MSVPTIAFTLPISCQICLGKVKQPVVCSNQHVFCNSCMELWTERNSQCPACRVPITAENPYRPIVGGLSLQADEAGDEEPFCSRELRQARIELLFKDYEREIKRLKQKLDVSEAENRALKHLTVTSRHQPPNSDEVLQCCSHFSDIQALTSQLDRAQQLYQNVGRELSQQQQECNKLREANTHLERENQRLRLEVTNRSPRRFGRYTVVTLQNKLDLCEREIQQLHRALEKSDEHVESLEKELNSYRKQPTLSSSEAATSQQASTVHGAAISTDMLLVSQNMSSYTEPNNGTIPGPSSSISENSLSSTAHIRRLKFDGNRAGTEGSPSTVDN